MEPPVAEAGPPPAGAGRQRIRAVVAGIAWVGQLALLGLLTVTGQLSWRSATAWLLALPAAVGLAVAIIAWIDAEAPDAEPMLNFAFGSAQDKDGEPRLVEMLVTMHHELRTPLNAVVGAAELLEACTDQETVDLAAVIREGAAAALALVNDVLELSRIEARGVSVDANPVPVRRVVGDVIALLGPAAAAAEIDLTRELDGVADVEVMADERRLKQVLLNLVGNAVKFTPAYGSVTVKVRGITASRVGDAQGPTMRLEFAVTDTGIGLSNEEIARLFRPYEQAGEGGRYGGSGLGLMISQRIVEAMGGTIGVTSRPGVGSTFFFSVKVAVCQEQDAAPTWSRPGARALFLGHTARLSQSLSSALEGSGMVIEQLDPAQAVSWTQSSLTGRYDLVLVEHGGGAQDGCMTLPTIVRHPSMANVPVIVVSRPGDPLCPATGVRPAARITVPIRPEVLRDRVERVLSQPAQAPASASFEELRVLLVEDDAINRRVLDLALRALGVSADLAQDGSAALQAATNNTYDLILLDHDLPELTGPEVARRLCADGPSSALIVGLSAWDTTEQRRESLAAGMNDYIVKPVTRRRLQSLLEQAAVAKRAPRESAPRGGMQHGERIGDVQARAAEAEHRGGATAGRA